MKKMMTVIIPVFNEERTIINLLNSLNSQDFDLRKIEVIVVDNCSTDNTIKVVKMFSQLKAKFYLRIITEDRKHVCAARNAGVKFSNGEVLIFLDADNIVGQTFLSDIESSYKKGYKAGTFLVLPIEKSLRGMTVFWILDYTKRIVKRPFGKNFCTKDVFYAAGGYNSQISLGTNVDFLTRVKRHLANEKKELAYITNPVFTSLRRFEKEGYIKILAKWFVAYMGFYNISY